MINLNNNRELQNSKLQSTNLAQQSCDQNSVTFFIKNTPSNAPLGKLDLESPNSVYINENLVYSSQIRQIIISKFPKLLENFDQSYQAQVKHLSTLQSSNDYSKNTEQILRKFLSTGQLTRSQYNELRNQAFANTQNFKKPLVANKSATTQSHSQFSTNQKSLVKLNTDKQSIYHQAKNEDQNNLKTQLEAQGISKGFLWKSLSSATDTNKLNHDCYLLLLPSNLNGKLQKVELRDQNQQLISQARYSGLANNIRPSFKLELNNQQKTPPYQLEISLFDNTQKIIQLKDLDQRMEN